jgi:DNA-binding GntR family transcriptional regulator
MPAIDRRPAYQKIAEHYRALILSEEMQPGTVLPSVTELATEWGVSRETAHKAMGQLTVAGLVWTSSRGAFVKGNEEITTTPHERARIVRVVSDTEAITVTAADAVGPPVYVTEILGTEPGDLVIRREEVVTRHERPVRLTVDWAPAVGGQITCAHLLELVPVDGGVLGCIERATDRTAVHWKTSMEGRAADDRESGHLRIPNGWPCLAVVTLYSDADGVLLYEENVLPAGLKISYEGSIGGED